MTDSEHVGTNVPHSVPGRGTLRSVSRGAESTRDSAGAPAAADTPASPSSVSARQHADADGVSAAATEDLESEVYAARDLDGDERAEVQRALAEARSQLSEATYRRALVLARDSVLLSIEECLSGAVAMEWEPMPRPEFSLETIEAAVAEQERNGDGDNEAADEPKGRTA
jgi:hypothetical protein